MLQNEWNLWINRWNFYTVITCPHGECHRFLPTHNVSVSLRRCVREENPGKNMHTMFHQGWRETVIERKGWGKVTWRCIDEHVRTFRRVAGTFAQPVNERGIRKSWGGENATTRTREIVVLAGWSCSYGEMILQQTLTLLRPTLSSEVRSVSCLKF